MADEKDISIHRDSASPVHFNSPNQGGNFFTRTYNKTIVQVAILGLVVFMTPGMFNALSGFGGGGQLDPTASNLSNVALNAVFAGVAFFAGTAVNTFGVKPCMFIGTLGYSLYIGSFLSYNYNANGDFVTAAGAILGACAGLLWSSQGSIMLSYPTEGEKGLFTSVFWVIFNLGAVIGSAIELGLTYDSVNQSSGVGNAVYVVFLILTVIGACLVWTLKYPGDVIRSDGTRVVVPKHTTFIQEFYGLYNLLKSDPLIVLAFPLFFASNYFYTWQFQDYNAALFTDRARGLNSMLYWMAQMVGSYLIGLMLDNHRMSRRSRAYLGWFVALAFVFTIFGGSYAEQLKYTRTSVAKDSGYVKVDLNDGADYAGKCILYLMMGLLDSVWQCYVYYLIGSLSNDLSKLAHIAGFYKGIQSAGASVAYDQDHRLQPYMTNLAVTWALCGAGLLFALPLLHFRVTDTTLTDSEVTVPGREEEIKAAVEAAHESDTKHAEA